MEGPDDPVYTLEQLKGLDPKVAALLVDQESARQRFDYEMKLKELDIQREHEAHQWQMERLRQEAKVNAQRQHTSGAVDSGHIKGPKVPKFTEKDDIDVYLQSFERLATVHGWDHSTWATRLAASLSGKALEAFARMSAEDSSNYDKVHDAILSRYELTGEAYRKKFRYT